MQSKDNVKQITSKNILFISLLFLFNFSFSTNIMIYIPDQYELPGIDSVLTQGGFDVTVTNRTATPVITNAVLANYNQFWLWSHATTGEDSFSDSELYSIRNFWQSGGDIVLMADDVNYQYQDFPNQICDSLYLGARFFGTVNHGQSLIPVQAPDFDETHQLWSNVDSIFAANHEGNIEIIDSSNVTVIGRHNDANMIAIGEYDSGFGKIVFQSSFIKFGDDYIALGDDAQHSVNIAEWLEIPARAIVAYYPFNGNANDESGNGNDGTVNGATLTNDRFEDANSAYSFDGVDDYTDISNLDNFTEAAFSYSVWVKLDSDQTEVPVVLNTPVAMLHLASSGSRVHPVIFNNRDGRSPGKYLDVPNVLAMNTWHHIVLTADGDNHALYIDSLFVDSTSTNQTYSGYWPYAEIGASGRSDAARDRFFKGSLDDIRIYNYALTEAEIYSLYHENGWPINESIDEFNAIPAQFTLRSNYPNPFNPVTMINYDLPERSMVTLNIYDLLGREVAILVKRIEEPGYRNVQWNGTNQVGQPVSAGVYLYRLTAGDPSTSSGQCFVQTNKMILLK